jgi:hypothetical protein
VTEFRQGACHLSREACISAIDAGGQDMTFLNEGQWDRTLRIVAGVLLLVAGAWVVTGGTGTVLAVLGSVALVTGISGWCPAYSVCGVSTRNVAEGHGDSHGPF